MYVKGSRPAMLFITAVDMENPEYTEELSRQLWLRVWGKVSCGIVLINTSKGFRTSCYQRGMNDEKTVYGKDMIEKIRTNNERRI